MHSEAACLWAAARYPLTARVKGQLLGSVFARLEAKGLAGRCQFTCLPAADDAVQIVAEAANGPITPDGDLVLRRRGITVLPDM